MVAHHVRVPPLKYSKILSSICLYGLLANKPAHDASNYSLDVDVNTFSAEYMIKEGSWTSRRIQRKSILNIGHSKFVFLVVLGCSLINNPVTSPNFATRILYQN